MLVLAHQRRFPTASTSFIQKIGEGILVFTRMPRQLDHHRLVFFHRSSISRTDAVHKIEDASDSPEPFAWIVLLPVRGLEDPLLCCCVDHFGWYQIEPCVCAPHVTD